MKLEFKIKLCLPVGPIMFLIGCTEFISWWHRVINYSDILSRTVHLTIKMQRFSDKHKLLQRDVRVMEL